MRVALAGTLLCVFLTCVKHACCVPEEATQQQYQSDEPFFQEVSHKSVFDEYIATEEAPVSSVWEQLPFPSMNLSQNALISLFPERECIVTVSFDKLYGTTVKDPAPKPPSLESPMMPWELLDSSLVGQNIGHVTRIGDKLYAFTPDNVLAITLTTDAHCGAVASFKKVLIKNIISPGWGSLTCVHPAPEIDSIFVGTQDFPVRRIAISSGNVHEMCTKALGIGSSTLLWVPKQKTLYNANSIALYWAELESSTIQVVMSRREFIGGVIGTTPTDLAYDVENNWVWLAETEAVHKITSDGAIFRFGYAQQAPMYNISSVAVAGGVVWVGSHVYGMARLWSDTSPEQVWSSGPFQEKTSSLSKIKPSKDPANDPWSWQYYSGPRWLPNDIVLSLIADEHAPETNSGVFAITSAGIAYIHLSPWTLREKAGAWASMQFPQHDRHGYMCSVGLSKFGDRSSYVKRVTDNDGLWTSSSVLAQGYRHAHAIQIGDDLTAANAKSIGWRAFEGLEKASKETPAYPRYVGRSFCRISDGDSGCPSEEVPGNGWYNGTTPGWMYKGDTSSDTLSGHMVSYPLAYDHLAGNDEERSRVLALIEGITQGIIENNLFLIDPETNMPTKWGYWNPKWLNDDPQYYSERGGNSLEILAWCASAYSITGKLLYYKTFWMLVDEYHYDFNILNTKIDSCVDENHSDTNLNMLAYHTMFYSLWRLDDNHPRYLEVKRMTDVAVPGLRRTWLLLKDELDPTWLAIIAGTARLDVPKEDISAALWSLRHWAIDGIVWSIRGSQRTDLTISTHPEWFHVRLSNPPVPYMKFIRPPAERLASERNLDPFAINSGSNGGGDGEVEPALWEMPYYMCLATGILQ